MFVCAAGCHLQQIVTPQQQELRAGFTAGVHAGQGGR
jgi:hypothetical protein